MRIVPRSEWGAANPKKALTTLAWPVSEVWLHHTVTNLTGDDYADMRRVQQVAFGRGFIDTSYTACVFPSGVICEGRGLRYVGAHTADRNSRAHGIALVGNYDLRPPTPAQVEAVRWFMWEAKRVGSLQPGIYPTGGHRDAPGASTACPGALAYARLDEFRRPWRPQEDDMFDQPDRDALKAVNEAVGRLETSIRDANGMEPRLVRVEGHATALRDEHAQLAAEVAELRAAIARLAAGGQTCVVAGGQVTLTPPG